MGIALTPVAAHHGAIMVGGFLGTLILLEKVIPLKNKWLMILPLLNALSSAITATIATSNGVIYVIDQVLLPPSE